MKEKNRSGLWTSKEATATVKPRREGDWARGDGHVEKWADPRHISKGELSGFANALEMGDQERREMRDACQT